ncbi:type II/IV secretion system ATPase subunit [Infirmifilum sp. NZ]|uniref:type II/IV secretion system ATPase subunit n=1 Tax=Infirmifilum sp. NZ TaxID=2926850 RepID=UPI0027AADE12|nr:type II/IV secretion system ATPase subunit [Infirmifilum sp. NZ]UNQ72839.1 type II/IV secretion system ATPase subunit [Infirmifilum sp. NZ]
MCAQLINTRVDGGEILLEFYEIAPPYAYALVVRKRDGALEYRLVEPPLTPEDVRILERIKRNLLVSSTERYDQALRKLTSDPESFLEEEVKRVIKQYKISVSSESFDKYLYYIMRDTIGYGRIDALLKDKEIEDISCDGVGVPVYVWHKRYESIPTNVVFEDREELASLLLKLTYRAGKQVSVAQPIVEGTLPMGYRLHVTLDEVSRRGGTFTIRKFREVPFSLVDLVKLGTISPNLAAYLWYLIENNRSLMVVGATAGGKTTTLNAVATFIRPEAKVVTIEDTPELRLPHENWVPLVTRPSYEEWVRNVDLFDLLKSAMRMRPDYIIIGEVRGEEAFTLFQAIATGHAGMCTLHAENIDYAVKRLISPPMNVPIFLLPMMNVVILVRRLKIGERIVRRVVSVQELLGVDEEGKTVVSREVFRVNPVLDRIEQVAESEHIRRIAEEKFTTLSEVQKELERRVSVIEYMAKAGMTSYEQISRVVRDYYRNPEVTYRLLMDGYYAREEVKQR